MVMPCLASAATYQPSEVKTCKLSPNTKSYNCAVSKDDKDFVNWNGQEQKTYEMLQFVNNPYSGDSTKFIYLAARDNKYYVVLNGKEQKGYDYINANFVQLSPDSKQIAYVAKNGINTWVVILNNKEYAKSDSEIYNLKFSPDSKAIVYQKRKNGKSYIFVNNIEQRKYDLIGTLQYSPDSKQLAYVAKDGGKYFVVWNGKEQIKYTEGDIHKGDLHNGEISRLQFSPDSKELAYIVRKDFSNIVVVNGKEQPNFGSVAQDTLFSPNSKNFAYILQTSRRDYYYAVVNGKKQTQFKCDSSFADNDFWKSSMVYSPNSRQLVFWVLDEQKKYSLIINNKAIGQFDCSSVSDIVYSPNSKNFAFMCRQSDADGNEVSDLYLNAKVISTSILIFDYKFSLDSKQLVYVALKNGQLKREVINIK